jgi:hypothetical protein
MTKYFLKAEHQDKEEQVTKEQFIRAERNVGFHPKCAHDSPNYWTTCATGGFSGSGMSGRIEYTEDGVQND